MPPDIWQDWYFSPPEVYRWHIIPPNIKSILETLEERFPDGIPQANEMTGFTSWYPWKIFYQRGGICGFWRFDHFLRWKWLG